MSQDLEAVAYAGGKGVVIGRQTKASPLLGAFPEPAEEAKFELPPTRELETVDKSDLSPIPEPGDDLKPIPESDDSSDTEVAKEPENVETTEGRKEKKKNA